LPWCRESDPDAGTKTVEHAILLARSQGAQGAFEALLIFDHFFER